MFVWKLFMKEHIDFVIILWVSFWKGFRIIFNSSFKVLILYILIFLYYKIWSQKNIIHIPVFDPAYWHLFFLLFPSPAWFCAPGTLAAHSHRPHPEDQGCRAWAGQSAVPQDEEDSLPGEAQRAHGWKPGGGGGGRNRVDLVQMTNDCKRVFLSVTVRIRTQNSVVVLYLKAFISVCLWLFMGTNQN